MNLELLPTYTSWRPLIQAEICRILSMECAFRNFTGRVSQKCDFHDEIEDLVKKIHPGRMNSERCSSQESGLVMKKSKLIDGTSTHAHWHGARLERGPCEWNVGLGDGHGGQPSRIQVPYSNL